MHWLDWVVAGIPLMVILYLGVSVQKYVRNVADFLAAGRKAGRYLLTVADGTAALGLISVVATFEMQYKSGFAIGFWNNLVVLVGLMMTLTGFVTYRYRETRAMTMAQFYEMRYSRGFRIFAGTLAFLSGLINYALFPAVAGRFVIYYCALPQSFHVGPIGFNTFGCLMALFLGVALFIVLTGGQLTTMVSDCCQGIFAYFCYAAIVVALLVIFSISDVRSAVMDRPDGQSFFNPFNVGKLESFNLLYIFIGMFGMIYNRNAWLGSQGYMCSAINPHEQKMAGVLGQWRAGFTFLAIMLLSIGAYTYMNSAAYAEHAAAVHSELAAAVATEFPIPDAADTGTRNMLANSRETIQFQMLVPVALRHILPVGMVGIFLALMLFLMVSTDTAYLHSWGTILVQDVILPIRNRPLSPHTQFLLLRLAIGFIAVFAWLFSFHFSQGDFILQFFAMTGTIYMGGAGACMLGGLYWRKGTTAGAFAAMSVGLFFALLGFLLNQQWGAIHAGISEIAPDLLERFRENLALLGDRLPFADWSVTPEEFARRFPITGQEIYFLGMLAAIAAYIGVSLLSCRRDFNLDRMLHRGKYNLEHFTAQEADPGVVAAGRTHRFNWKILLGITAEYSRNDRILAWSAFLWVMYNFLFFLVQAVWNLPEAWRWKEETWVDIWIYYTLPQSLLVGTVTTIWFTWGSLRDLRRLVNALKSDPGTSGTDTDDGLVEHRRGRTEE